MVDQPVLVFSFHKPFFFGFQYWAAWQNYNTAISYLVTVPKYRLQAQDIARQQGLLDYKRKRDRTKTKEEIKEEEENVLKRIVEEKMDIRY